MRGVLTLVMDLVFSGAMKAFENEKRVQYHLVQPVNVDIRVTLQVTEVARKKKCR